MSQPSAVPPDPGVAGAPAGQRAPRLDDLIRLPPGPRRQEEIMRIVAGLAASLASLHETGRLHGGICPAAVAYDPSGQAMLATPPAAPEANAEDASRHAGYAAFEQYTDDPAYPCGAWTDVHGLAALAYFLATGSAPPSALARCVRDDCLPLHEWGADEYGKAFCDAVDSGLAMPAHARPQTAAAFAAAMGAFLPPPLVAPAAPAPPPPVLQDAATFTLMAELPAGDGAAAGSTAGRLTAPPPQAPSRARRILPLALVFVLLLAGGGYAWIRSMTPPVQLAGTAQAPPPAPARAPEAPPAAPPAAAPAVPDAPPAGGAAAPAPAPAESAGGGAPEAVAEAAPEAAPAATPAATPEIAADAPAPPAPATAQAAPPAPPKAAPVTVRVAVRPWGEVLVNGRSRGVSPPLRELSLAPGRYQVTVRNASAGEHRMTLTVAPDRPAAITHEFE